MRLWLIMIKYVMRNPEKGSALDNALVNNKRFDSLNEAVSFAREGDFMCWIDEIKVRPDGKFKSTENVCFEVI